MKIGYKGIAGGYGCRAANLLADSAGLLDPDLISFTDFAGVAEALVNGTIDMGAAMRYNSLDGEDKETAAALGTLDYAKVTAAVIPLHLCVYGVKGYAVKENISKIVSSSSALKQTEAFCKDKFLLTKMVEAVSCEEAAQKLAQGEYGKYAAVICQKDEGTRFGLTLMYENVEDKEIMTLFDLIRKNS